MYTIFPTLSDEQIEHLLALRNELTLIPSRANRRRIGENGNDNLSEYADSRWFTWTASQRQRFRDQFPEVQHKKALVAQFLELPANTGLLDRMTYWQNANSAGTMLSYALKDDQEILLNDQPVIVTKGQGIGFNLRNIHEIKPSENGQLWACFMVLGDPDKFKPN